MENLLLFYKATASNISDLMYTQSIMSNLLNNFSIKIKEKHKLIPP